MTKRKCENCKKSFLNSSNLKRHQNDANCKQTIKICNDEKVYKCNICSKQFANQSNLNKHEKNHCIDGSVKNKLSETVIANDEYDDVLQALPSIALKYKAAQKMGVYAKNIFPLCFYTDQKDQEFKEKLEKFFDFEKSENLLISMLNEVKHLKLNKNLTFINENVKHDITNFLKPPENDFDLEDCGNYFKVTLKPIKRRLDALASELFQVNPKKQRNEIQIMQANNDANGSGVVNNNAFQNNANEGEPPENHIDPPEGRPPGGQGGDPGDGDPDDPDDGGGGGGGGGPIPPNNNDDEDMHNNEGNNDDDAYENYLLRIRELRDGLGRGRGTNTPYYSGQGLFHFENLKHKDAYIGLYQASSTIQQYISMPLFPKLLTNRELQILTGHQREKFDFFLEHLCPPQFRFRKLSPDAKAVLYLSKLKQGSAFDSLSVIRNLSKTDCHKIFWDFAMYQYYHDPEIPHRNITPKFQIPTADQILQDNIVTDEYILGIFQDLIQPGQSLVIWGIDHTYLYMPYISSIRGAKRTHSSHKKKSLVKYGVLCNYLGKPIRYTPISASINQSNGDGNLTTLQLEYEINNEVFSAFDELIRPQNPRWVVITVADRGYIKHTCLNDRGTNHTLQNLFNNPEAPRFNPNSRLIYPLEAKNKLFGEDFRPIENPEQENRTGKLTCREASDARLCTRFRWVIEAVFMHMRQFRQLDMRFIDEKLFDPCGDLLPENVNIPKIEIIFNNILSNLSRNNKPLEKTWPLPSQITWHNMGRNFEHRRMLHNEFDKFEQVQWPSFKQFPQQNAENWTVCQFNDPRILFNEFSIEDFTMVTHGPYQIKNGDKYLSNICELKVIENIRNVDDITWQQYDLLCTSLPNDLKVAFTDIHEQPRNWNDELFGQWFPRRLLFGRVPNRISGTKTDHKVIISYIPNSPEWDQPNNINRLGFLQPGLKQIIGYGCISEGCSVGFRLAGCCSHVATILLAVGVYAFQPDLFKSTYKNLHFIDIKNHKSLNQALFRNINVDEENVDVDEQNENENINVDEENIDVDEQNENENNNENN